jgi:hypothetical protein
MLRAIVRHSLGYPWLVIVAATALGGAGVISLQHANYDVFPNFAPPIISIDTLVPGLAPEDVESLVTTPIEDAVNGVPGLAKLRSQSVTGLRPSAAAPISTATGNGSPSASPRRHDCCQRGRARSWCRHSRRPAPCSTSG